MLRGFVKDKKAVWHLPAALVAAVILILAGVLALFFSRADVSAEGGDAFRQYAEEVYALRVEDLTDTAAVATLLEAMEMETEAGKYSVTIAPESDVYTLSLSVGKSVKPENKASFDEKMGEKSQQILALIPQLGKVEWHYSLRSDDAEEQEDQVSESVDTASAGERLGRDVRDFGTSREQFEELLAMQAGQED